MSWILHVGWPKTGTTSIQRSLVLARPALLEIGILYPRTARIGPAHHPLALIGLPEGRVKQRFADRIPGTTAEMITAIEQEAAEDGASTVLLSSENFIHMKAPKVKQLVRRIESDGITVVIALRPHHEFLEARYKHSVTHDPGFSESVGEHLTRVVGGFHYARSVNRWVDRVPANRWKVILLESGDDSVTRFYRSLELLAETPRIDDRANRSLTASEVEVVRRAKVDGITIDQLAALVRLAPEFAPRGSGATPLFGVDERRTIWESSLADQHAVAELLALPEPTLFAPPVPAVPDRGPLPDDALEDAARRLRAAAL